MGLFGGLIKNTVGRIFPKNTVVGKILGSDRKAGTGLIGNVFEKKAKAKNEAPKTQTSGLLMPNIIGHQGSLLGSGSNIKSAILGQSGIFSGSSGSAQVSTGKDQTKALVPIVIAIAVAFGLLLFGGKIKIGK